jgi:hypothetical protein
MSKVKEITEMLIDIFDRINIDTPSNFDDILEFVVEDVEETADKENWHDGDVAIAFRRWIELNQNKEDDEINKTETLSATTEDALFESFYKKNNSLRYCNGSYYKFEDKSVEAKYNDWRKNMSKARSFELYYGNGVVD